MNPLQTLRVAVRAIIRNGLRSFLTTLGIIIGVGAVIAMMAIGAGAKARVEAAFAAMGTDLLVLLPGSTTSSGVRGGFGSMPTLTWDDLAAIRTEVSTVKNASPSLRSNQPIISEDSNWTTGVYGVSPEYFEIRSWPMSSGDVFNEADVEATAKIVILGQTVADKLYGPNSNPVGQMVRIGVNPFKVVAVASKKGQSASGTDYDDCAFIPFTTHAHKLQGGLGKYLNGQVYIQAQPGQTTRAQTDVTSLMRDRHKIPPSSDDDFSIRNLAEIASAQQEGTNTITTLLACVALVSLVVGGIGIMNIMLVSVTERTREIGVRMALGAKPMNILSQFLIEALTLSVTGGIIGVLGGVGVALWLTSKYGWPTLLQPEVITISVGFSGLVGVVFGLYPAWKASQLDPIEALRYE
jgi:putative ABC transport system permease protein